MKEYDYYTLISRGLKYMNISIYSLLLFIVGLISSPILSAKLLEFETSRLSQTAGTGAATLLINESTLLNPAAIAFFRDSTVYYQRTSTELDEQSNERVGNFKDGLSEFYSISDTTTSLKGSFSYLYQNEAAGNRKRIALSSAAHISEKSALGVIISHTEEETEIEDGDYIQITIGAISNITNDLILGFVYTDPALVISEYSNYVFGVQYRFSEYFTVMADAGSGDVRNPDKSSFTRAALQISATDRLFLRYGVSHDKFNGTKGVGYGLSWVGPKFALEYSIKNEKRVPGSSAQLFEDEEFITTSLGITAFL